MVLNSPLLLVALALAAGCASEPEGADPLDSVDPFVATGGPGFRVGSATPAATVPFGMVKLGPDTAIEGGSLGAYHCGGYYYTDYLIVGFSHMHMHGVGVPAEGNILFMPGDGIADTARGPSDWQRAFSHETEVATPGYYEVTLDNGIRAQLSATMHAGQHRYIFPEGTKDPTLAIDLGYNLFGTVLGAAITVGPKGNVVTGQMAAQDGFGNFPVWFRAEFDTPFTSSSTWSEGDVLPGAPPGSTGSEVGAILHFAGPEVRVRVGLSLVDPEGAKANLHSELRVDQPIEATASAARELWDQELVGWEVVGGTEDETSIFWTALYHLSQMPTRYGDADGRYVGFDQKRHTAKGWNWHSDLSLWDTYRTAQPAFDLFYPDRARDFALSLLAMSEEGGAFPKWPVARWDGGSMIGAPADIALADAIVKGVPDIRADEAWTRLVAQAKGEGSFPYNGRPGVPEVETIGWLPAEVYGGSVSWLQELAWADNALAHAGEALGDHENASHFAWRAYTYRNVYDPEIGYFHGRYTDGTFAADLNPLAWADEYVEGNAEQYLWLAPWDPEGLAELLGGEEVARERLESFLQNAVEEGQVLGPGAYYWHGNEPDIHAPWLFALWGDPEGTVRWVRWVEESQYHVDPDGLAGNDDAGTLSAWYIFAALGFYPIAGSDVYVLGAPMFDRVSFPVRGGTFTVERIGDGERVDRVLLNDVEVQGPTFRHREFVPGGTLRFEMVE